MAFLRRIAALAIVAGTPVVAVAAATPASAATVSVAISVASYHCPPSYTAYVDAVSGNGAYGYGGINTWIGHAQTAHVTVFGVPSGGMPVTVDVAYTCEASFWRKSTPEPIQASRWAYGSGSQPSWLV